MNSSFWNTLQWPAMAVTLASTWLIASRGARRRRWGFWLSLLSNLIWTIWGAAEHAWAVIGLQVGLAFMNIRGIKKNEQP
jgi:hypothetical protein